MTQLLPGDRVATACGIGVESTVHQSTIPDLEQKDMLILHPNATDRERVGLYRHDHRVARIDDLVRIVTEIGPFFCDRLPESEEFGPADVGPP